MLIHKLFCLVKYVSLNNLSIVLSYYSEVNPDTINYYKTNKLNVLSIQVGSKVQ